MHGFKVEVRCISTAPLARFYGPPRVYRNVTEIHLDPVGEMLTLKSSIHDEETSRPTEHIVSIKAYPEPWGWPAFREKVKDTSTEQGD